MLKVILITTEGCRGCRVMNNILKQSIESIDIDITLESIDCKDSKSKKYIDEYKISDFPTVFLSKNNKIVFTWQGTLPLSEVTKQLKQNFT